MKLSYNDTGSGDPALVFIHGWCCDRSYFAPQADHFAATHRVVAIDQRGHGKSAPAPDGDYSVAALASDAAELIESLGLDRPVVVGHSLGGLVTLQLAASRPELVLGGVMVDPAPIVLTDGVREFIESMLPDLATGEGRLPLIEGMFISTDDAERKARIIEGMTTVAGDVAVPAFTGITTFDGAAALAACTVPIATIGAAGNYNDGGVLQKHNPNLIVAQTLGAGHFNQLEVPDQVNAMIEQFLRLLARS